MQPLLCRTICCWTTSFGPHRVVLNSDAHTLPLNGRHTVGAGVGTPGTMLGPAVGDAELLRRRDGRREGELDNMDDDGGFESCSPPLGAAAGLALVGPGVGTPSTIVGAVLGVSVGSLLVLFFFHVGAGVGAPIVTVGGFAQLQSTLMRT